LTKSPDAEEKQEKATEKCENGDDRSDVKSTLGTLQFTVGYDVDKSTLAVSVICAKNLPIKNDSIGTSDPYVKLQLLPEKRQKVIKHDMTYEGHTCHSSQRIGLLQCCSQHWVKVSRVNFVILIGRIGGNGVVSVRAMHNFTFSRRFVSMG